MSNVVLKLVELSVDQLVPNTYNPNEMPQDDFKSYCEEVRRLGRIPKPVVARPKGDSYEIVDGEHAWRAAQEVGLLTVPCEVIEVDDFEAMLQTYKRNQHGKHNPLLQGRMFMQMLKSRKKPDEKPSMRKLAREIDISDGTIRNGLKFVKAAKVRRDYAGECRDSEIAHLSVRQVEIYLALPDKLRDAWLDAGGIERFLQPYIEQEGALWCAALSLRGIVDYNLVDVVQPSIGTFAQSLHDAMWLCKWLNGHKRIPDAEGYVRQIIATKMPFSVLHLLPVAYGQDKVTTYLTVDQWRELLEDCAQRTRNEERRYHMAEASVRVTLKKMGIELCAVYGPQIAEHLQELEAAPDFIRNCAWLTLDEQLKLFRHKEDCSPEDNIAIKKAVCERLGRERGAVGGGETVSIKGQGPTNVETLCGEALVVLRQKKRVASLARQLSDMAQVKEMTLAQLNKVPKLQQELPDGRPAITVLADELEAQLTPAFVLLATALMGNDGALVRRLADEWLKNASASTSLVTEEKCSAVVPQAVAV